MYNFKKGFDPKAVLRFFEYPFSATLAFSYMIQPKSLYIRPALCKFYGKEYRIWAGFGFSTETFYVFMGNYLSFKS